MPQTAEQIQQIVQQALTSFDQLADATDPPALVLRQLIETLTQATAGYAGLVWMPAGPNHDGFRAAATHGPGVRFASSPQGEPIDGVSPILNRTIQEKTSIVVAPDSPELKDGELSSCAQFFIPIDGAGRTFGVLQLVGNRDLDPKTYRQYAAFAQQAARAAGNYLAKRQNQLFTEDAANQTALLGVIHKLLKIDAPRDQIHELATTARGLLDAQRVAVVDSSKRRCEAAFSDTIHADRKAVLVRTVELLAEIVLTRQSPMTFVKDARLDEEDEALAPLLDQLFDLGAGDAVCLTPIRSGQTPDRIIGVLLAEYTDAAKASRTASLQQELCRQAGPILCHTAAAHRRPLRRTSAAIAKTRDKPLTTTARAAVVVAFIAAFIYALWFVPVDIVVRGNARLEPSRLAQITAPLSGRVEGVPVETGQRVAAGDVLVQLDDRDLRLELNEVLTSIEEERVKLGSAGQSTQSDPEALAAKRRSELTIKGYEIRAARLRHQIEDAKVRSPIDGIVLTETLEQLQNMTVNTGALMLRVADLSTFELVTELKEEDLALLDESLRAGRTIPIEFLAHAWPNKPQKSTIRSLQSLAPTSAPDEYQRQHVFRVTTPIELTDISKQLALANPTGRARLTTGRGSIAYRYGRGVWRFLQMTLFF